MELIHVALNFKKQHKLQKEHFCTLACASEKRVIGCRRRLLPAGEPALPDNAAAICSAVSILNPGRAEPGSQTVCHIMQTPLTGCHGTRSPPLPVWSLLAVRLPVFSLCSTSLHLYQQASDLVLLVQLSLRAFPPTLRLCTACSDIRTSKTRSEDWF